MNTRRMTAKQLEAAARSFDREDYQPKFLTPPPSEKRRHDAALKRARQAALRSRARRIQITIERNLLAEADRRARKEKISRSELVARGLRLALAS